MPMAPAEIMTVVQSVERFFKLSNAGPIIGSIYQDRLTAIAGIIGRMPNTTHFEVQLEDPGGKDRKFQGELYQDEMISPIVSALNRCPTRWIPSGSSTFYMDTTMDVAGHVAGSI